MNSRKPILKQFADLTEKDFNDFPIWVSCHIIDYDEDWYDDTDEETYRPWTETNNDIIRETNCLVKTRLTLFSGDIYSGISSPEITDEQKNENDLGGIQPHIFTRDGELFGFWSGMFQRNNKFLNSFYSAMGKSKDQIFPIKFEAETSQNGMTTSGTINGFLSIKDFDKGTIEIIK
jgi:hypothetical protein